MFWALACLTSRRGVALVAGGASGFLLAFVTARFISGNWAF
jgi:hypothetical protein